MGQFASSWTWLPYSNCDGKELMSALDLDKFQEIGNLGAAHAATVMGQMLERTIMIGVTRVRQVTKAQLGTLAEGPDALVAGVQFHVVGDASARILLWMPRSSAVELVDALLRQPTGTTKALNEMGQSTVKETGNIMASAYLNGLSDSFGMLLLPSVPNLSFDISAAVLDLAAEGLEPSGDLLTVLDNSFTVEGTQIKGLLFLFIDASSIPTLNEARLVV